MRAIASASLLCRTFVGVVVIVAGVYYSLRAQGAGGAPRAAAAAQEVEHGVAASGGETIRPGTATATIGGREISATADGAISVQGDGVNATLKLAGHVVRIERLRVLVDGKERAKLPASATKLHVTVSKGRLTITMDGRQILAANE